MKYYLQYKDDKPIGYSNIPLYNEEFDNKEVTEEEYNAYVNQVEQERKINEERQKRIDDLQMRLTELTKDIIQMQAGAVFDDEEQRIQEFQELHNELRGLLGKEPREYN